MLAGGLQRLGIGSAAGVHGLDDPGHLRVVSAHVAQRPGGDVARGSSADALAHPQLGPYPGLHAVGVVAEPQARGSVLLDFDDEVERQGTAVQQ